MVADVVAPFFSPFLNNCCFGRESFHVQKPQKMQETGTAVQRLRAALRDVETKVEDLEDAEQRLEGIVEARGKDKAHTKGDLDLEKIEMLILSSLQTTLSAAPDVYTGSDRTKQHKAQSQRIRELEALLETATNEAKIDRAQLEDERLQRQQKEALLTILQQK